MRIMAQVAVFLVTMLSMTGKCLVQAPSVRHLRALTRDDGCYRSLPSHANSSNSPKSAAVKLFLVEEMNETASASFGDIFENMNSHVHPFSAESIGEQSGRFLAKSQDAFFRPLECGMEACKTNLTWSQAKFNPRKRPVVIPCGTCIWMDHQDSGPLKLPLGLDIQGHLYFPDGYSVTIETPFVLVQGFLDMASTGTVEGDPLIEFVITGDRTDIGFLPAHNNEHVCPDKETGHPGACNIGFRSIAVAGGRVNLHGVPAKCTTWTHLQDVVDVPEASEPYHYKYTKLPHVDHDHPNPTCRALDPYIQHDFETDLGGWTGGYGARVFLHEGRMRIVNRKSAMEQGPTLDMVPFQDCLVAGQLYLFEARVRLWDPAEERGTLTPCAEDGETNCLELHFSSRLRGGAGKVGGRVKKETKDDQYRNYKWQNFYALLNFTSEELDGNNIYHLLQLRGAHERYNIDMDNATISLPHASLVPDPGDLCGHNLIMNGNAEGSDIHPYPLEAWGGHLEIKTLGEDNNVFKMSGRNDDKDSLAYRLDAPNCIKTGARYRISAKFRSLSENDTVVAVIRYRIHFADGNSRMYTAASCPPSMNSWVSCRSKFAIVDEFDPAHVDVVRFWFETIDAPTVDYMVDNFKVDLVKSAKSGILVPSEGVKHCWGEGSEVLITSHTTSADDSQVRRLVNKPIPVGDGMVRLELDDYIVHPVTAKHDGGLFPVEIALLSRNIRFRAEEDAMDPLMGGHFIVLRTPDIEQRIEGVEFSNFGQQGELGRYPIHLHLCKNTQSVVSKNTVRGSNQRCVVIHGSHNATVVENIAYDTKGHCFMTEDGGELDNKFLRNLGSNTKFASRIVREGETDVGGPSTFWSANPSNEWVGNVAAGCAANGYWFELLESVKGPTAFLETSQGMRPRRLPLSRFIDNVAHSNYRHGLKMYPHGLLPDVPAIFENFQSYKNRLDGIFFRNVVNSVVRGGVLADNRNQADFDRSDTILIEGTRLIGSSRRYREIVETQNVYDAHGDRSVGLELHPHTRNPGKQGLAVKDIVFEGFAQTYSEHNALVEFDRESDDVNHGLFDYFTTFQGISIKNNDEENHFDFSRALANSYNGLYVVDLDSSMNPTPSRATGTSSIIADSAEMKAFVQLSRCTRIKGRGCWYCRNTCLRSITFAVDPGESNDLRLRVRTVPAGTSFLYEGSQDFPLDGSGPERHERAKTDYDVLRYFTATLPAGDYKAVFVNGTSGDKLWPAFVEILYEPYLCDKSLPTEDVVLDLPSPKHGSCEQLIRNGDIEQSSDSAPYWLHHDAGIKLERRRGVSESNALTDTDQNDNSGSLGQYVDSRCFERGETYLLQAWVYLERGGSAISCDFDDSSCPKLRLRMRTQKDYTGQSYAESDVVIASEFARPFTEKGWNLMQGTITVDERLANATSVLVYVVRRRAGTKLFLDNVSMTRVKRNCNNLIFNGDFSEPTSLFWQREQGTLTLDSSSSGNALRHSDRKSSTSAITQRILTGCMKQGDRYTATARMRVLDSAGNWYACNPNQASGDDACPRLRLRAFFNYGHPSEKSFLHPEGSVATGNHGMNPGGWLGLSGVFAATKEDEFADQSVLYIDGAAENMIVVVDDVSIRPVAKDCKELILNGDAEDGDTVEFWKLTTNNDLTTIKLIETSTGHGFRVANRFNHGDGIMQNIDSRCLVAGSKWKVAAQMKFRDKTTNAPVACDPNGRKIDQQPCPAIRISAEKGGSRVEGEKFYMTNHDVAWVANAYNKFESKFEITSPLSGGDRFQFAIRNFDPQWDMLIDNISVTPLTE